MNGRALVTSMMAIAAWGCEGVQAPLDPAGPQAQAMATLTWWFFGVCGAVFAIVIAVLGWALVRRRRDEDDLPQTTRRIGLIIAGATALTVAILIGLVTGSVLTGRVLQTPDQRPALVVKAIGHQWWWEFQYSTGRPDEIVDSPNELHVPVGVPVLLQASSRDVIHSLWVPALMGKRDLVPGIATEAWIQADRPGEYRGQCAEFCGYQHANMAFVVVAEPMAAFERWLQTQRRSAEPPSTVLAQRGHDVFMTGPCVLCHTIRGTIAGSRVGPDLTHVATRRTLAAGTLPNTRGHRAGWIADSQSVKPGNRMPPNLLTGDDLLAVVAYLETLQ